MAHFQVDSVTRKIITLSDSLPEFLLQAGISKGIPINSFVHYPNPDKNDPLFGSSPDIMSLKRSYKINFPALDTNESFFLFPFREPDSRTIDITVGKSINEIENLHQSIIEKFPWPLAVIKADFSIYFMNKAFANLFYSPKIGEKCYNIIHDKKEVCFSCPLGYSLNRSKNSRLNFRCQPFKRYFEENLIPFCGSDGTYYYTAIALYDNTEQMQIKRRSDEIQKINALGRMAAGIAHDFNNLLTTIIGRAQILSFSIEDEKNLHDLKAILTAAEDSATLVRRIQLYSSKKGKADFEAVSINKIIEDALEIASPKWHTTVRRKGKILEVEKNLKATHFIQGNQAELRTMMVNLIFNAVDAMEYGGVLSISSRDEDYFVIVEVSDTGAGIEEENLSRIFDPFFTTKGDKGSGLGLAEVAGTVNRHNGTIEVNSKVGEGTTFIITFPRSTKKITKKTEDLKEIPKSLKIAIVDDNLLTAETLDGMLTEEHSPSIFTSPEEFIAVFRKTKFDLVFTDLGMPNITGDRLAKLVKEINPNIPVILVTGWFDGTYFDSKNYQGYIDFVLQKPFTKEQLNRAISVSFKR